MTRDDLGRVIVASAADVEEIPWSQVAPGVDHKVLWQSGDTTLGLMRVLAGAENPEHTHHAAHHHILIMSGDCELMGRTVGPGSYVYVPPGVPHAVVASAGSDCTFFYTYRPLEQPADPFPLSDEGEPV